MLNENDINPITTTVPSPPPSKKGRKPRGSRSKSNKKQKSGPTAVDVLASMPGSEILYTYDGQIRSHVTAVRCFSDTRKTPLLDPLFPVTLSLIHRAPPLRLSEDQLTVTGWKGFRSIRSTHGAFRGSWYCEATITHLGSTGHCRLGWCTRHMDLKAPVGFDIFGFGYRDVEGSKLHEGRRESYGESYGKEGDVIGLWIYLPDGGKPIEPRYLDWVRFKGQWMQLEEQEEKPRRMQGSMTGFSKNGKSQGVAFRDFAEGTYYACASLFTLPDQDEGASVSFNFGPHFSFPPPGSDLGLPPPRPLSDLAVSADKERRTLEGSGEEGKDKGEVRKWEDGVEKGNKGQEEAGSKDG